MPITNQDIKIYLGDSAKLVVNLTTETGEPYQPLADQVRYRIARNAHTPDTEALIIKDLGDDFTITDGVATINLSASETATLTRGLYSHAISVANPPEHTVVMIGTVKII